MGITKTQLFTKEENQIAIWAKALGHPARIAILKHIMSESACICTDLVMELGLSQATISQHLKALKEIGLIQGEIEGVKMCYCLHTENWQKMQLAFEGLFKNAISPNGQCC
jgi:ArsR family transcriptional regulator, arsenate/arsenite/antimonite-responsive transcriptional repressor